MTLWEETLNSAGVKVSQLEDTWWGRLMAKYFDVGGFNPGWHIWVSKNDWNTIAGAWTLKHELVHSKQFKKWKPLFWLGYLFVPPARIKWEIEAYKNEMRRTMLNGKVPDGTKAWIYSLLDGKTYWWYGLVCPTTKWIEQAAKEVEAE